MGPRGSLALFRLAELDIVQQDPKMTIEDPDTGYDRTVLTDGTPFDISIPGGMQGTAHWKKGGRLEVEYETPYERKVHETWELVADGERILLTLQMSGGHGPKVEIKRVFDRVDETEDGASAGG